MTFSDTDLILNRDGSVYHLSLLPHQVADKIIIVGDPGRVHRISSHFDAIDFEMNKREFITMTGRYQDKKVTVMSTGMGTDNMEIVMVELDALFNIDLKTREPKKKRKKFEIVRIGTSGAIQESLKIGSEIVADYGIGLDAYNTIYKFPQSDFETAISTELKNTLELPYMPYCVKGSDSLKERLSEGMIVGNTVTSPGFYAAQGRIMNMPVRNDKFFEQILYFNHKDFWLTNFEMETSVLYAMAKLLGHQALSINAILANRVRKSFIKNPNKPIDSIIKKVLDRL
jgi:uridine phosphorylase